MRDLEFGVLGPLQVRCGGRPVAVTAAQQRVLLAVLVLHTNRPVTQDLLIQALWGQAEPRTARVTVQNYVRRLRSILRQAGCPALDVIQTCPGGYRLAVDADAVDVLRFGAALEQARAALRRDDRESAVRCYRTALQQWRGDPVPDLAAAGWLHDQITRLVDQQLAATEEWADLEIQVGRPGEVIDPLTDLLGRWPFRESLHAHLIRALVACGRTGDALDRYQQARKLLVDELGIEPGPLLRAAHQQALNPVVPAISSPSAAGVGSIPTHRRSTPRGDTATAPPVAQIAPAPIASRPTASRPIASRWSGRRGRRAASVTGAAAAVLLVAAVWQLGPVRPDQRGRPGPPRPTGTGPVIATVSANASHTGPMPDPIRSPGSRLVLLSDPVAVLRGISRARIEAGVPQRAVLSVSANRYDASSAQPAGADLDVVVKDPHDPAAGISYVFETPDFPHLVYRVDLDQVSSELTGPPDTEKADRLSFQPETAGLSLLPIVLDHAVHAMSVPGAQVTEWTLQLRDQDVTPLRLRPEWLVLLRLPDGGSGSVTLDDHARVIVASSASGPSSS